MNKIVTTLILIIVAATTIFPSIAFAAEEKIDINKLMPNLEENGLDAPEIKAVSELPDVTSEEVFSFGIETVLEWSMLLTIIAIVMAAIYYIQSLGNEEDLSKAKNIIIYLIIGMAIIAAAYGIVSGISQFNFFKAVE